MSDPTPQPGRGVHGAGDAVTPHGSPAASTERVSFTGTRVTWSELPRSTSRAAARRSPILAEAVECLATLQPAGDGSAYQWATAWRVHDDAVVLASVRRHIPPAVAGYYVPGRWEHVGVRALPLTEPLRRRRGLVPVALDGAPAAEEGPVKGASVPTLAQVRASVAWQYLPEVVRRTAERLVPEPSVWLGEIVQSRGRGGWPIAQSVQVLRMDDLRAVVVVADRALPMDADGGSDVRRWQLARTPWLVEQIGADLDPNGTRSASDR